MVLRKLYMVLGSTNDHQVFFNIHATTHVPLTRRPSFDHIVIEH